MENYEFTLGVDVSKLTLDITCSQLQQHVQILNNSSGFGMFTKWCRQQQINLKKSLIVMEYTGGYEYRFIQFCQLHHIACKRVPGLEIKNSQGITRGKNDKVDSARIAQYAEEKIKKLTAEKPMNKNIQRLKLLLTCRKDIVRESAGMLAKVKETKHMYDLNDTGSIIKILLKKIEQNKKHIKAIETEMMTLLKTDEPMLKNYKILNSIKGIGMINALMTICYTENFTSFTNARAYGAYIGVVPYEHSSGTSIKGKKRVSHLAHKALKQELNQAAKNAMQWDKELNQYAQNKLKTKDYAVVLNNVKFKLVLRMFALVKRGECFVENYVKAA
jgi:transposase